MLLQGRSPVSPFLLHPYGWPADPPTQCLSVLKSVFPCVILTEHGILSFLLLALHHALPRHDPLKLPSELDWGLVYCGSSYWILRLLIPLVSVHFCIRICREMFTLKRKMALNYHLGVVRILLKSHGSFKKSWKPQANSPIRYLWCLLLQLVFEQHTFEMCSPLTRG